MPRVERAPPPAASDVVVDSRVRQKQKGCPIPRVLCEEWEPRTPTAYAVDVVLDFARVERTLLSVAFDVDLDFHFLSQKTPRLPHPCANFAQGWDRQTPAGPPLTLTLLPTLPV